MFEIIVAISHCLLSAFVGLIIGIRIGKCNKQIQRATKER